MDAFPVDLKIEEMESHQPKVKFYRIETHTDGEPGAYAALMLSDLIEKRLVHLENNFATIMRLLFRLGARIHVNCVYWGGTTPHTQKYKCIRCMRSDRVNDGKLVQIDQCLYCTRYEPVFGQSGRLNPKAIKG